MFQSLVNSDGCALPVAMFAWLMGAVIGILIGDWLAVRILRPVRDAAEKYPPIPPTTWTMMTPTEDYVRLWNPTTAQWSK